MPATGREPLINYLQTQALTDAEIRRIMKDAAREAERIVAGMGEGIGKQVRQAQLAVSRAVQEHWRYVGDAVFVGIGDAADSAGESLALLNSVAFDALGINQAYWTEAMLRQAREGIESLRSRKVNGIGLSERVYKNGQVSSGHIDRLINAGLANGASAREIAKSVRSYVHPDTPGGASYAAMRLGRTEVNNAFHTTSRRMYAEQPWIAGVKWSLSRSHPHADECDQYATGVHMRGGAQGVFPPNEVPDKPHPQCFCYVSPVTVSDDEFVRRFKQGRYDNYVEQQVGCRRA